jgi:quercetin dioxygenase-like cupin family protein
MGFAVYDYRTDLRNVLVTPQIRSRFVRMEPGPTPSPHSHDLGQEVFLVLSGRALFEIDGETKELGPGQMCVALVDQLHSVSAVGDEPMVMYLSVTPHVQPTHTMWTGDGTRMPHRFTPSSAYDIETDTATPIEELIDRNTAAVEAVAEAAQAAAGVQRGATADLKKAIAVGDDEASTNARNTLWEALFEVFNKTNDLAAVWNDLAPRAANPG